MFQKTIVEIIQRVENIDQPKRSIVELDITDIKDQIQDTLFQIGFTQDSIIDEGFEEIQSLDVTNKEALGLFFLSFIVTLKKELSYNSFWVSVADALLEFEEDKNTFFIDSYFVDNNKPTSYLTEAMNDAVKRFNLRSDTQNNKMTRTVLLQIGLLKRSNNLNYWLTSNSKNNIIDSLTNRASENFSSSFNSAWKTLQRYTQGKLLKSEAIAFLKQNIWFKDFEIEGILSLAKEKLHSNLISIDDIEQQFFLKSVRFEDKKLQFTLDGDDFYILNFQDDSYDVYIDGLFQTKLLKNPDTDLYELEQKLTIEEPENYKIKIEIKDKKNKTLYEEEFVLFDFNHDILIFDEDGKYYKDPNIKLDESKTYSLLLDSDFEVTSNEDDTFEYFDGYVNLLTNITKDSDFKADDGDEYIFSLNFTEDIQTPSWLNNLELYATSDFLSLDTPLQYQLRYNKMHVSTRQVDSLTVIEDEASIVRWSYSGGVVYNLDSIEDFNYDMDLSHDILINRKNTLKIKVDGKIFTKQLNVTIIEKTAKPKYRTFLKDIDDNITFLNETNRLTTNDIESNQMIITSFHEDFLSNPELKTQILRDKSNIFDTFELNKPFTLTKYPYYAEEISSVKKIYDDVQWNTFCSITINGIVKSFDEKTSCVTLTSDTLKNLTLITLDNSYKLQTQEIKLVSNKIEIPSDLFGFCLVEDGYYVGSYFTNTSLDIETIFANVEVLKFLRVSYYPFAKYFNGTEYEKNRAQRERARNLKKKDKRLMRLCIKTNPFVFLKAFLEDELVIDDIVIKTYFNHSKAITEQILYAIEFEADVAVKIIHEIILNRWQEKIIQLPVFLVFILNTIKNERYYQIFLEELTEDIEMPDDVNEEFVNRMTNALVSNHKIDRYEKINLKTITQLESRDFYTRKAITKLIEKSTIPQEEEELVENRE